MATRVEAHGTGVSLSEKDLEHIKNTVLTLERQEISRNVDPRRFFAHLRAKFVFDERDCDEICACTSRIASAELFVDILKRKGAKGYDEFCVALMRDKTQTFLLQNMNKTLELLRSKVLERKGEERERERERERACVYVKLYPMHWSRNLSFYHVCTAN